MTYQASHRFARISPRKARLIVDLVQGQGIEEAMATLEFSKRRGAYYLPQRAQERDRERGGEGRQRRQPVRRIHLGRRGTDHQAIPAQGPRPGPPDPQEDQSHPRPTLGTLTTRTEISPRH